MTCVVGVTEGRRTVFGADSAAGQMEEIYEVPDPKIFRVSGMLFGACGSYRIPQIMQYHADLPAPRSGAPLTQFLAAELVPALRAAILAAGAEGPSGMFLGEKTALLVGFEGQLACITRSLAAIGNAWGYAAIGSGRARAYGAFHALRSVGRDVPIEEQARIALEAASATTPTVRGPYRFEVLEPAVGAPEHGLASRRHRRSLRGALGGAEFKGGWTPHRPRRGHTLKPRASEAKPWEEKAIENRP